MRVLDISRANELAKQAAAAIEKNSVLRMAEVRAELLSKMYACRRLDCPKLLQSQLYSSIAFLGTVVELLLPFLKLYFYAAKVAQGKEKRQMLTEAGVLEVIPCKKEVVLEAKTGKLAGRTKNGWLIIEACNSNKRLVLQVEENKAAELLLQAAKPLILVQQGKKLEGVIMDAVKTEGVHTNGSYLKVGFRLAFIAPIPCSVKDEVREVIGARKRLENRMAFIPSIDYRKLKKAPLRLYSVAWR
ncbi:MAG: hypothetical protein GXO42_00550 [bacterium]|nr:hypothetical protein [bacterium]